MGTAAFSSLGGMGKFVKARPKCLDCNLVPAKDGECFCEPCSGTGPERAREVKEAAVKRGKDLRTEFEMLRAHCQKNCAVPSGDFLGLPPDAESAAEPLVLDGRDRCSNLNCQAIFKRVRIAKQFSAAAEALVRLKVSDW